MTDQEFLRAFFDLSLDHSAFHHRDHLRLAGLVVRRDGPVAAEETVAAGIQRYAVALGHGDRYHDTMTRFWVRLVAHALAVCPATADLEDVLTAHPLLLDPRTPLRHWSRDALFAPDARAAWRPPDVLALPF